MSGPAVKVEPVHEPGWGFGEPSVVDIPPEAHTYAGFMEWVLAGSLPEKLPVTFVHGLVMLDMSEQSLHTHVAVKAAVYHTVFKLQQETDFGEFYPEGVLYGNPDADVSTNPDGLAVLWETINAGRVRFVNRKGVERAVEGSPDWILEVVSDSSVKKDTVTLREAYHRAGISEYWLIDARGKEIVFQILQWRKSGYAATPARDGWLKSRAFGCSFRLTRKRNRRGAWVYKLETRPADA